MIFLKLRSTWFLVLLSFRQLSTEQAVLQESLEKESKVNKRLSMENEELLWKLHNGDLCSPKRSPTSSATPISSPIKDSTLNILSLILQIELPKRVKEKKIPWFKRSENHYNLNSNHLMLILSSPQADTHLLNSITIWWHSVNLVLLCISQKEKSLKQNLISTLGKK